MVRLSWDQFQHDCIVLADKVRASGHTYDKLLSITRGGVFVGSMLAYYLDIRNITTVALRLYEFNQSASVVEQLSKPDMPLPGSRVLVVDDLLDSGRTMEYVVEKWGQDYKLDIAVLYDKGGGHRRADFTSRTIEDEWVWFPWEPPGK